MSLPFHPKGLLIKLIIPAALLLVAIVAARAYFGRTDLTKPDAVAAAFMSALKGKNLDKAASFYVPDGAKAWQAQAKEKIDTMQSGTYTRFFEDLPSGGTFPSSRKPGMPQTEQTMTNGTSGVDVRQIDGKWYVSRAPV